MADDKKKSTKLDHTTFKTKDEALKAAFAKIKKDYGEESISLFGDKAQRDIPVISTGSISLDVALGVGGYPRGRIIEIYGLEASGKCLVADTYVWTTDGFITIAEMFERNGLSATCSTKTTERKDQLVNRNGEIENTTHFTHNGRRPVFYVKLEDGSSIKSTSNHPHLVMNERGSWAWKQTGELTKADVLIKRRGLVNYSTVNPSLAEDDAYALGALVADGCFTDPNRIRFTNNDPVVVEAVLSFMKQNDFAVRTYSRPENNTVEYHFNGKELMENFMVKYGLKHSPAAGKCIPYCVRTGGSLVLSAFLRGYVDCESYLDTTKTLIEVASTSNRLLEEVQQALLYCGVQSRVREKTVKNRDDQYWRLEISGPSVSHYMHNVGFRSTIRIEESAGFVVSGHSNVDLVLNVAGLLADLFEASETTREHNQLVQDYAYGGHSPTYMQLDKILSLGWTECAALHRLQEIRDANYVYVPVEYVTLVGEEPTFDFAMENTHSFIANGLVTHNTTMTLHAIAQIQKAGGIAAFVDAEHALDPKYASNLGVNMDALVLSQPSSGEEALDIVETLVSSGAVDMVVIDSVAALVPQAELDADMGQAQMGAQARLMSQALRKLTALADKTGTIVFFINQVRMKIGVMFGCFHGDTLVSFADGSSHTIRNIVENQLKGPVFAWDEITNKFVTAEIVDWHNNGKIEKLEDFVHIQTSSVDGAGRFGFTLTPDHKVLTSGGWKHAKDLIKSDCLISKYHSYMNGSFADFMWGTLVGDSHLAIRTKNTACLKLQDNVNIPYLTWKVQKINEIIPVTIVGHKASTDYNYEWAKISEELGQRDPEVFLDKHYSPLGLALWYMDDGSANLTTSHCRGTLSIKRFSGNIAKLNRISSLLFQRTGVNSKLDEVSGTLRFNKSDFLKLCDLIAAYVPPCMAYKLPLQFRGEYQEFTLTSTPKLLSTEVPIVEIRQVSNRQFRQKDKYDITVEGQHTYLVGGKRNGVIVHNSPETTSGGNALKYYCSVRLDIRKAGSLKLGDDVIGGHTRVKVIKNKVAPPFKEVEFDIRFGKGIHYFGELVDLGVEIGLVDKAGAWYSFQGERIGQGRDNACEYLAEHPETAKSVADAIRKHYGLDKQTVAEVA